MRGASLRSVLVKTALIASVLIVFTLASPPRAAAYTCPMGSSPCNDLSCYVCNPDNSGPVFPPGYCNCGQTDGVYGMEFFWNACSYGGVAPASWCGPGVSASYCYAYVDFTHVSCFADVERPEDPNSGGGGGPSGPPPMACGGGGAGPGPSSPPPAPDAAGEPVSLTSGNMFFTHIDAVVGELTFSRTYNSGRSGHSGWSGAFGPGWNASLERRLRVLAPNTLEIRASDGSPQYYFDDNADGVFEAVLPYSVASHVEAVTGGGYRRLFRAGGEEDYDANGAVTSIVNAAGVATAYSHDGQGRLSMVSRFGRSLVLSYSGSATSPSQLKDGAGTLLATYTYQAGNLAAVSYPDGSGYRYFYDTSQRIVTVQDAAGLPVEAHSYDSVGHALTSEIGGGIQKLTFSYGTNQTTVTDALGNATTYEFANVHGINRVTKITGPCSSCGGSGGDVQQWAYDALGNITSYTDGNNKTWTYTYDSSTNDLLTVTDPLNQVTSYTYDSNGRVLTQTGPDGSLTTYTYVAAGPATITDKIDATTNRSISVTYGSNGKPATITDPRSKVTGVTYNSTGDIATVTDPLSHAATLGYDAFGRQTTATDALGHTTTTSYDAFGRVTRVTNHDGTHADFAYDKSGRRISSTDPLGRTTYYGYDAYGRLTAVLDPLNGATKYSYDVMSSLTSLTDAKGQVTTFSYDTNNRVSRMTYPGGAHEDFAYDSAGRLATKTDRKGVTTTYAYDALGQLTAKSFSDGTTPSVSYTYDAAGRMLTAANGTDTLTWAYDLTGRLVSEQSSKNSSTVAYANDLAGNRISVSLDGSVFVTYAYDDAIRLTSITRGTNVFGFAYDDVNRRTSLTYPNGVTTTYGYDNLNRTLSVVAANGGTTVASSTYTYDLAGNRVSKAHPEYSESYGYDKGDRLTRADRTGSAGAKTTIYGYDAAGNRLTEQVDDPVTPSNSVLTSYTYDGRNGLLSTAGGGTLRWRGTLNEPGGVTFTSATVNGKPAQMLPGNVFQADIAATTGTNTVTIVATDNSGNTSTKQYQVTVSGNGASNTYDANGNLTQKVEGSDTWGYEWNAENQLTRVTKNGSEVARFRYDPIGRRVESVASGATTTWVYDGPNPLKETTGTAVTRYIQAQSIDEPLAKEDGSGALTFFHTDAVGSVLKTTNGSGAVVQSYRYSPFGTLEAGVSGYAFTGREWSAEAGLYYYRGRYYDPKVGRFISEDPIRLKGGYNLYAYVRDNPINLTDPTGLAPCTPSQQSTCEKKCKLKKRPYQSCSYHEVADIFAFTWCTCYPDQSGDCTPIQHATMQMCVKATCDQPRACKGNQTCDVLKANLAKNTACAAARNGINNMCYGGGDSGHQNAADEAAKAAATCTQMILVNCK